MFYVQTENGKVVHDFAFHLIHAIEYQNWINGHIVYDYDFSDELWPNENHNYPIGNLQFVEDFLEKKGILNHEMFKPINIPTELNKPEYTSRNVLTSNSPQNPFDGPTFVKSASIFKGEQSIINSGELVPFDDNLYFFSEEVEIDSEYRGFVFNGELKGIQHYQGDFRILPDFGMIDRMIENYKDSPLAYTIDIGINKDSQFLIEIHPFVSCGLYGFADYRVLTQMMIAGVNHITK